jgi:hypothetical protein
MLGKRTQRRTVTALLLLGIGIAGLLPPASALAGLFKDEQPENYQVIVRSYPSNRRIRLIEVDFDAHGLHCTNALISGSTQLKRIFQFTTGAFRGCRTGPPAKELRGVLSCTDGLDMTERSEGRLQFT